MELGHKTTILLSEAMHARLTRPAARRGTSMGALIREAVEARFASPSADERLEAVAALAALGLPVGDPAQMKAESVEPAGELP